MTHVIKIRFGDNEAVLSIDNNTITVGEDIASIITSAIATYLSEWFMPMASSTDNVTYIAPTSTMKVRVTKSKDEVEFVIEE